MTKQQEVEQRVMRAAGWTPGKGWPQGQGSFGRKFDCPGPVQIKMHHGAIVEPGWENALRSILMGVATLVEKA